MKYLSPSVIDNVREHFVSLVNGASVARIFSNGTTMDLPVYKSRTSEGRVEISLKIPVGISEVEKIQVFNQDEDLLIERTDLLVKSSTRAVYTKFDFDVREWIV